MAQMLALYKTAESAAQATEALDSAGVTNEEWDVLTDAPYPEGAFGEHVPQHRLFRFTMLGAIIATVLGILFESRIPNPFAGIYDERITEGYIGITIVCDEDKIESLENIFKTNGAEDIIIEK